MYHMLVTDIDGTLLDRHEKVPKETKKIMSLLREKGFIITIATGRILGSAEPIARQIDINAPLICCNGALIIDLNTRHRIVERPIDTQGLIFAVEELKKWNYEAIVYDEDGTIIVERLNERTQWYLDHFENMQFKIENDLPRYVRQQGLTSLKIFAVGDLTEGSKAPMQLIDKLQRDFEVFIGNEANTHLEINAKGVNKGNAVKFLAEAFKVDREDVITIGDGHNDESMLKYAGLGIAMGNAAERIKEHADYITLPNCQNGLLKIVNEFILPQENIRLEDLME